MLENLVNDLKTSLSVEVIGHMVYLILITLYAAFKISRCDSSRERTNHQALLYGSITGSCCTAMIYNHELTWLYLAICAIVLIIVALDVYVD